MFKLQLLACALKQTQSTKQEYIIIDVFKINFYISKKIFLKNFLRDNGYDLLDNETENAVRNQKFSTFKAFSENKAIKESIK
jgi:hypothetical protein